MKAVPETKKPSVDRQTDKPLWSRPAFETVELERTLNGASNVTDTSPVSKS